jgi:ribosomal protein S18 acetylase RimI-like enzyme
MPAMPAPSTSVPSSPALPTVRRLVPADARDFHALRLDALRDEPSAFGASLEEEEGLGLPAIEGRLTAAPDRGVFAAFLDGEMVGQAALGRESRPKMRHKAMLWGLYVAPRARGRGIGRLLLREVLAMARAADGVRRINLCVNARNTVAIGLYTAHGFEAFGHEPGAMVVDGEVHDEVHMSLCLRDG